MLATLLGDPFWLSIQQVKQLTDRQIHDLYFRARDDKGRVIPQEESAAGATDLDGQFALKTLLRLGAITKAEYERTVTHGQ